MTTQEREALTENIQKMIANSKDARDEIARNQIETQRSPRRAYEEGMMRGLERALSAIQDLDAIMADNQRREAERGAQDGQSRD